MAKIKSLSVLLITCLLCTACQSEETVDSSSYLHSSSSYSSTETSSEVKLAPETSSEVSSIFSSDAVNSKPTSSKVIDSKATSSKAVVSKPASSKATSSIVALPKPAAPPPPPVPKKVTLTAAELETKYQAICDTYSEKIRAAVPLLVEEYKSEALNNTDGTLGLRMIVGKKLDVLVDIISEAGAKMGDISLEFSSGKYSEYKPWIDKLNGIYIEEASTIHDTNSEYQKSINYYGEFDNSLIQ